MEAIHIVNVIFKDEGEILNDDFYQKLVQFNTSTNCTSVFIDKTDGLCDLRKVYTGIINIVYLTSICSDLKQLHHLIQNLANSIDSNQNVRFLLLDDLFRTERAYVYTNTENNFFRSFVNLSSKFTNINFQIMSTNRILNSWGEGDTSIVQIPEIIDTSAFWHRVKQDVQFHEMFNQGNAVPRLVSIQSIYEPNMGRPLYRHPNDEEPPNVEMIPVVRSLKDLVEQYTGVRGINHVLIQHYRHGRDNIAAHSDKTLDIDRDTPIMNLSLGVGRVMTIQNKRDKRRLEKIPLLNGECVIFGLSTNRHWHHEVAKDVLVQTHELFGQERISLTFRKINTFINDDGVIVGQGSRFKTNADIIASSSLDSSVSDPPSQTRSDLIQAFSCENKQAGEFDWQAVYGGGFLVR
jgi:alkylated DNA repair dioxygenase AlkB